jgi:nickel-dependent lactate racemase
MRTAAWYGDRPLDLPFPEDWQVVILTPRTPAALPMWAIREAIENPIGQESLRRLAAGKHRPVIIIDDLNRPTPTDKILPFVIACLPDPSKATIVVATGTHGPPSPAALHRKIGNIGCRVVVHDPKQGDLNEEVAVSDFLTGIGGIYPNHTAGFGGGSKLVLGVLGFRQIESLHHRHRSAGWGAAPGNTFRSELDEVARRIGLLTVISAHVNADRELVRIVSGDHFTYHASEADFAYRMFGAPEPSDADAVISNAYPNDLSLTFARMKGMTPLSRCAPGVSRVAIASCPEGLGFHGLFPFLNAPRQHHIKTACRKLARLGPRAIAIKAMDKIQRRRKSGSRNRVWVYRPGDHDSKLPEQAGDLRVSTSWPDILDELRAEHAGKTRLRILVYACAPLQPLTPLPCTEATSFDLVTDTTTNYSTQMDIRQMEQVK